MSEQTLEKGNKNFPPWELSYLKSLAELLIDISPKAEALTKAKISSLRKVYSAVSVYASNMIDKNLLNAIMAKKAALILAATSMQDVRELGDLPKPYYRTGVVCPSSNTVPEEELAMWALVSPCAKLSSEATERILKLFEDFYGFNPWKSPP